MLTRYPRCGARWFLVPVVAGVFLFGPWACGQEGGEEEATAGVEQETIPTVVMDALTARFPGAEIRQWTREEEEDVVIYDIEFTQEGRNCEADIREDGSYLNFEQAISAEDLPEAVLQTVEERYPGATLEEIMEITEVTAEGEILEGYEVVVRTADQTQAEITVAPDGTIIEDSGEEGGDPS